MKRSIDFLMKFFFIIFLFTGCLTQQPKLRLDYTYSIGDIRIERFYEAGSNYSYSYKKRLVKVYNGEEVIFSGSPYDIPDDVLEPIAQTINNERIFLNVDLYGYTLDDYIYNYSDLAFYGYDKEGLLEIYTPSAQGIANWDIFFIYADFEHKIKKIGLLRTLKSSRSDSFDFYNKTREALCQKYVDIESINDDLPQLAPNFYIWKLNGYKTEYEFRKYLIKHIKRELDNPNPEIERSFRYIENDCMGELYLHLDSQEGIVMVELSTSDLNTGSEKRDNIMLNGI